MTLNIAGQLMDMDMPLVMGILNVTPDSFYAGSRCQDEESIREQVALMVAQGAAIIDVGACSTRPGGAEVTEDEELRRLDTALTAIRTKFPELPLSIDTFRSNVARRCVQDFGVGIVNDASGGTLDEKMFEAVANLRVPYVLTHSGGMADATISCSKSGEAFLPSVARFFAERLQQLHELGVPDIILDPGFGFGKTMEQNYYLFRHLGDLISLFPDNPMLVGISRKSMITRLLGISTEEALNGTSVLNTVALQAGVHLLRVHDVRAAVEAVRLCTFINLQS